VSTFNIASTYKAVGNISPASFVKPSGSEQVVQCGAGDVSIGVSQPGTNSAPGTTGASPYAAVSGQSVVVYHMSQIVEVTIGAVAIVPGFVKADANGFAIQAAAGNQAAAYSFEAGNPGQLVRMMVLSPGSIAT
jgi:hypothetical protein